MNIEITGTVDGQYVEEKLISPKDLIKLFGLNLKEEGTNYFILADTYCVKDPLNGGYRHSQGVSLANEVSGVYNGNSYILRAFDTKRPNTKGSGHLYFPRSIEAITGRIMPYSENHLSLAVWAFLNKRCKDSPFREKGSNSDFHYSLYDQSLIAKAELEAIKKEAELLDSLMSMSDDRVMNLGRGMVIRGQQVGVDEHSTPGTIRVKMFNLAKKDPQAFRIGIESSEFEYKGKIGLMYDKGAILAYPDGNGKILKWKTGGNITRVSRGESIIDALFTYSLNDPESFFSKAKNILQKVKVEEAKNSVDLRQILDGIDDKKEDIAPEPNEEVVNDGGGDVVNGNGTTVEEVVEDGSLVGNA